MKQDDNIKSFFEKRLRESAGQEEGWNVPSDAIWNSAKEHFPKEQKRKRSFVFFWLGSIGIIALTFFIYQQFNSVALTNEEAVHAAGLEQSGIEKEHRSKNNADHKVAAQSQPTSTKNTPANIEHTANYPAANNKNQSISSNTQFENQIKKTVRNNDYRVEHTSKTEIIASSLEARAVKEPTNIGQEFVSSTAEAQRDVEEKKQLSQTELDGLKMKWTKLDGEMNTEGVGGIRELLKNKKNGRWEVGLTFAPFIINPEILIELEDAGENGRQSIDVGYRNFNVPVNYKLNKKFSLTSGFSWSALAFDLNIFQKEIYQTGTTDENLRNFISERNVAGSFSLDEESNELTFEFSEDANLQDGDEIEVSAFVPIELSIVQVPFLLNYHIPRGRFEWLLHAGFSVDLFQAKIDNINFEISKAGKTISENVEFGALTEKAIEFSFYAGGGLKYHINNKLNIGINSKIDLLAIPLSRYELGLFYKF